ncbi:TetR/AcrR family transcriptional regulator [Streptomyces sp. JW3]|uniref:TetR/AcrR family transcriptional regulator n=1 Tax=Streptomyces sp. JW3 TaxID=3456955 RepID=UPI003FA41026
MASTARTRRPRGSIDADMIVRGAFELARRDGLDSLSMPNLAAHLGTGVTSIYWYFKSKDELLQRMYAIVSAENVRSSLDPTDYEPAQWREFLRVQSVRSRERFRTDDLMADLIFTRRQAYDPETYQQLLGHLEDTLRLLMDAGFTLQDSWHLFWDLALYTRGFVVTERINRQGMPSPEGRTLLASVTTESMPLIAELVDHERVVLDGTSDASYEFGLDLMLDAAEARLRKQGGQGTPTSD